MPFSSEIHLISLDVHNEELESFGDTPFVVQGLQGVEGISQLFRFRLDLVSNHEIPFDKVMGQRVTLTMLLQTEEVRWFHGIISEFGFSGSFEPSGGGSPLVRYEATVVPRLWTLTRTVNSRVWEDKTVQEIIEDVLEKNTAADERCHDVDFDFKTLNTAQHPVLTYTVQYYESDFDFVSRIMEEQGLAYFLFHDVDHEHLWIFDNSNELPDLKDQYSGSDWSTVPAAIAGPVYGSFQYQGQAQGDNEWQIDTWHVRQGIPQGVTTTWGYDFKDPNNPPQMMTFGSIKLGGNEKLEVYEFQPEFTTEKGGRFGGYQQEAEEAASHMIEGRGSCAAFEPGSHFELKGSYPKLYDDEKYLITSVHHMLNQSVGHESGVGATSYENSFSALPVSIPFRSRQRTPKPSVHGTETAVVVGPEGREIETDKWGRIRIQFHWDHQTRKTKGENVCWARVATQLAGSGWGTVYTPRITQEVVVSFIQGNPDRPLVTGVVYNGTHKVPWTLDENKTQSGIKTRSSMQGSKANYNELRFEDKKGSEEILIHAEKDHTITVENNRTMSVGGDESTTITGDETRTVSEGDQKVTVSKGDQTVTIGKGDRKVEVSTGDSFLTVKGDHTTAIVGSQLTKAETSSETETPKMIINATSSFKLDSPDIKQTGDTILLTGGGNTITMESSKVEIKVGGSTVTVTSGSVDIVASVVNLNS